MEVSEKQFTLAPGKTKDVTVTLKSAPAAGSLYGALEIIGLPTDLESARASSPGTGSSVRCATTRRPRYSLKLGAAKVAGTGAGKTLTLAVSNAGNTPRRSPAPCA